MGQPRHGDVTVTGEIDSSGARAGNESDHLRDVHGLTKVDAWVPLVNAGTAGTVPNPLPARSATRMAKLRQRKRDAGLVSFDVPARIVGEVKAAGGWDAWRSAVELAAVRCDLERKANAWGLSPAAMANYLARPSRWRRRLARWFTIRSN